MDNIKAAMQTAGRNGEVIEIRGGARFITCNSLPASAPAISRNGRHLGVRVGNLVFDNWHPNGIAYDLWLLDFDAVGGISVFSVTSFLP